MSIIEDNLRIDVNIVKQILCEKYLQRLCNVLQLINRSLKKQQSTRDNDDDDDDDDDDE